MMYLMNRKAYDTADEAVEYWKAEKGTVREDPMVQAIEWASDAKLRFGDVAYFLAREEEAGALFLLETYERMAEQDGPQGDALFGVRE